MAKKKSSKKSSSNLISLIITIAVILFAVLTICTLFMPVITSTALPTKLGVSATGGDVISAIPDRSKLYQGQTPQSFNALKLQKLYRSLTEDEKDILTDAAKIFVIKGEPVKLVKGETYNVKITYPYDLTVAEGLLKGE